MEMHAITKYTDIHVYSCCFLYTQIDVLQLRYWRFQSDGILIFAILALKC
jgi:hypothetical protein